MLAPAVHAPPAVRHPILVQAFVLANKTVVATSLNLVVDASNGSWWGAPLFLTAAAPGLAGTTFVFQPSPINGKYGQLVHAATGLCVDVAGVPYGHNCLHPNVRGLPYCN